MATIGAADGLLVGHSVGTMPLLGTTVGLAASVGLGISSSSVGQTVGALALMGDPVAGKMLGLPAAIVGPPVGRLFFEGLPVADPMLGVAVVPDGLMK